jgi:hypothetical protein
MTTTTTPLLSAALPSSPAKAPGPKGQTPAMTPPVSVSKVNSEVWELNFPAPISSILANDTHWWNYRSHDLLSQLRAQVELFACSGGVWTQTTDVQGEVNGMMTYDRKLIRMNETMWREDIQALYNTAARRANESIAIADDNMGGMQYGIA